ncbi:MAG: endonuclease V [Deferribacterota bacterium]|nr:endonuclease V [Deferribacterota bacterium]
MYGYLINLQRRIASKVILEPFKSNIDYFGGIDVAFSKNFAFAAIVILDSSFNLVDVACGISKIKLAYIPGLLSFREFPAIYQAYKNLNIKADIYLVDGQGIAHPRGLGIASHIGVILNIATIGCAKKKLVGDYINPPNKKFSYTYLYNSIDTPIGAIVRSRERVKPIFVSPGHKTDIESSVNIIKRVITKYRLPEPIRYAHQYADRFKKEKLNNLKETI